MFEIAFQSNMPANFSKSKVFSLPNFNNDVIVVEADLILKTGDNHIVHVAQDGGITVRSASDTGTVKWSGKFGQSVSVYPDPKNGYDNDDETQIFRQV